MINSNNKNYLEIRNLLYFIAILQWSIGHPSSASIGDDFWLELVVRQMMFSRIPPKQEAIKKTATVLNSTNRI
jgi:hypothetical protein